MHTYLLFAGYLEYPSFKFSVILLKVREHPLEGLPLVQGWGPPGSSLRPLNKKEEKMFEYYIEGTALEINCSMNCLDYQPHSRYSAS